MEDTKLKCQDCGNEFTFTVKEQKFYEEKGFVPPKRCKFCRHARTLAQDKRERRANNGWEK